MIRPTYLLLHDSEKLLRRTERRLRTYSSALSTRLHDGLLAVLYTCPDNAPTLAQLRQAVDRRVEVVRDFDGRCLHERLLFGEKDAAAAKSADLSKKARYGAQQLARHPTLCCVDFEAYYFNKNASVDRLFLSEAGVSRLENGQVAATLHCFFRPTPSDARELHAVRHGTLAYVQRLTQIPLPRDRGFG